jgi:hypothetical protein
MEKSVLVKCGLVLAASVFSLSVAASSAQAQRFSDGGRLSGQHNGGGGTYSYTPKPPKTPSSASTSSATYKSPSPTYKPPSSKPPRGGTYTFNESTGKGTATSDKGRKTNFTATPTGKDDKQRITTDRGTSFVVSPQ